MRHERTHEKELVEIQKKPGETQRLGWVNSYSNKTTTKEAVSITRQLNIQRKRILPIFSNSDVTSAISLLSLSSSAVKFLNVQRIRFGLLTCTYYYLLHLDFSFYFLEMTGKHLNIFVRNLCELKSKYSGKVRVKWQPIV